MHEGGGVWRVTPSIEPTGVDSGGTSANAPVEDGERLCFAVKRHVAALGAWDQVCTWEAGLVRDTENRAPWARYRLDQREAAIQR